MSGSLVSKRASSSPHYSPHHCSLLAPRLDSHLLPSRDSKCSSSRPWTYSITVPAPPTCSCPRTTPDSNHMEKLNPPVCGVATTPDNDHLEGLKPGGVRRQNTGPVRISLYDQGESDNEDPNLTCDEGDDGEKAVTCRLLPFGDRCQGGNNELFDSARFDQVDGWTTGNERDPCGILLSSTKDWGFTCLAGGEHGMTIFGA